MGFRLSILYTFYLCTLGSNWLIHVDMAALNPWEYWILPHQEPMLGFVELIGTSPEAIDLLNISVSATLIVIYTPLVREEILHQSPMVY